MRSLPTRPEHATALSACGLCIGYIPGQRDIRPVTSRGRGQCLSGAEEVPRAKPEALPRQNESMRAQPAAGYMTH